MRRGHIVRRCGSRSIYTVPFYGGGVLGKSIPCSTDDTVPPIQCRRYNKKIHLPKLKNGLTVTARDTVVYMMSAPTRAILDRNIKTCSSSWYSSGTELKIHARVRRLWAGVLLQTDQRHHPRNCSGLYQVVFRVYRVLAMRQDEVQNNYQCTVLSCTLNPGHASYIRIRTHP